MDIAAGSGRGAPAFPPQLLEVFDNLQEAVYVADMETYEVLYANARARAEFGSDLVGRRCYEVFQDGRTDPCSFCTNDLLLRDGRPAGPYIWEFRNTWNGHLYRCIDRAFEWPEGRLVRIELALDITDCREIEEERDLRLRTEETLLAISMRLHHPEDLDGAIEESLEDLGRVIGASRAYVFEIHGDGLRASNTHEWADEGIPRRRGDLQDLDWPSFDWAKGRLEGGEAIAESDVEVLPEPERTRFLRQGIVSVLAVPMFISGRLFGFMGFDETRCRRVWRPADIRILQTAAQMIAKQIAHQQSEARYRALFSGGHDAILLLGADGRIAEANGAASRLTGRREEDLLGLSLVDLTPPEDGPSVEEHLAALRDTGSGAFEVRILGPDGVAREAILSGARVEVGHERLLQLVLRDISAEKSAQRERERLQTELFQAQKLEAIGRLAGGIAHDFNNILGGISACAALLRSSLGAAADGAAETIDAIDECVERAAMLTRNLLDFASARTPILRPVAIREVVEKTLAIVGRTIGRSIRIETEAQADVPVIRGDEAQLVQCLLNLCLNARDAMPIGGVLRIEIRAQDLSSDDLSAHPGCSPGRYAVIGVSDTGIGIPPEIRPRIFEPFFTTKEKGKGIGLGLSTVYGIVQRHGGFVAVESEPGRGSRFSIHLPAASREAGAESRTLVTEEVSGTESVLLVDDDPTILESMGLWLVRLGYRVLRAPDGEHAFAFLRAMPDAIDIAVIDIDLPGMGGQRAIQELRAMRPRLPLIAWSGLGKERCADIAAGGISFLPKPCPPAALAREIRRILGGSDPRPPDA